MGFMRAYSEQGDPFGKRSLRAGRLVTRHSAAIPIKRKGSQLGRRLLQQRVTLEALRRAHGMEGDPFKLRLPKFVRKLSLKKVGTALAKVGKVALPIAATVFTGGLGGAALGLASSFIGGSGGGPEAPAPELVASPPLNGTVGEVASRRTYEVPGVEVFAERARERAYLDPSLMEYHGYSPPGDYDEGDEYDDDADYDDDDADYYDQGEDDQLLAEEE